MTDTSSPLPVVQADGEGTEFAARIKARRLALGFTLREVEDITGGELSNGYLSQLENGKIKRPSAHVVLMLCAAYAIDHKDALAWLQCPVEIELPKICSQCGQALPRDIKEGVHYAADHRIAHSTPTPADEGLVEQLEFRPRENGEFDEIVARFSDGMVHVETMSGTSCYVGFYWNDGRYCQWWINSSRKLEYHHEDGRHTKIAVPHCTPTAISTDELVEEIAREIERYGEGLVPELRIVTVWLAKHFRDGETELTTLRQSAPNAAFIEELRPLIDAALEPKPEPLPEQDSRVGEAMAGQADSRAYRLWRERTGQAQSRLAQLGPAILAALSQSREQIRAEAFEEAAKVARNAAEQAANIALEGGDRARANESMEAMATRIAEQIERL